MQNRRRALVLTDESARHPFLRSLPPHVRGSDPGQIRRGQIHPAQGDPGADRKVSRISFDDVKRFFAVYCTAFLAVTIFIA